MPNFYDDRPCFRNLQGKDDLVGVEIGVDSGLNAEDMLLHLDIKKLFLIDPWCGYAGFNGHGVIGTDDIAEACYQHTIKIMEPFKNRIEIIRKLSEDAVDRFEDESLDFVYIDGNHRYEYVLKDINLYWPKIKKGGFLMGHDYKSSEQGVIRAVRESFKNFDQSNWDWWKQKKE